MEAFVNTTQLRDALGIASSTFRKWIQRGKIEDDDYARMPLPEGGRALHIDPAALPEPYRTQWVMHQIEEGDLPTPSAKEVRAHAWKQAAQWRKDEAQKRYAFYRAVPEHLSTDEKKAAIALYKEETHEDEQPGGVSMASWYRYRKAYDSNGLTGLMPDPRPSRGTKVEPTDYNRFRDWYLTRDRRSATACWRRVYGAAKAEGRDVSDFPVPQTFVNQVKRREGEDKVTICRHGLDYFNQQRSPYISRDWSTVPAGDVWFSDHRLFDVFVLDEETGEVGRPWITPWMDAHSTMILGYDLYLDHPNSDRIHLTFKRACEVHGLPTTVYVDNGKDYRALDFAGGPDRNKQQIAPKIDENRTETVLDLLNVDAVFARPYNARAKTIERKFQFFIENLEKFSRGYAGQDAARRPEITEKRRKAATRHPDAAAELDFLCTLSEFRERVSKWVDRINRMPGNGKTLQGHSPKEIFYAKRGDVRRIDKKHLGILCMRTSSERLIRRCEWRDSALGITYTADWMYEERVSGRKAFARRDPQNPETAWIFDATSGKLLGTASPKPEMDAMAQHGSDQDREDLEAEIARQQRYIQQLKREKREIENRQPSEEEFDAYFDAWLDDTERRRKEEGDYLHPPMRRTEATEHETAAEWLHQAEQQDRLGADALPYEAAPKSDSEDDDDIRLWPDE